MKRGVASVLGMASICGLTACGEPNLELKPDTVYCLAEGTSADRININVCNSPGTLMYMLEDGSLLGLRRNYDTPSTKDIFQPVASITDGVFDNGMFNEPISGQDGKYRLAIDFDEGVSLWLTEINTRDARKLKSLWNKMGSFDEGKALPEPSKPYVDQPLCQMSGTFRNGKLSHRYNICEEDGAVTILANTGQEITLFKNSLNDESGAAWSIGGDWSLKGATAQLDRLAEYTWLETDEGVLATEALEEKKDMRPQWGRNTPFDPARVQTQHAFPYYEGSDKEAILSAYREHIYPELRRRLLIVEHFPELKEELL